MKTALLLLFVFTVLALTCCAPKYPTVTLAELMANPAQYNGQTLIVEGIYLHGWQGTVLTQDVSFVADGNTKELKPVGDSIWVAGMIPLEVQEKFYVHSISEAQTQRYGKVRLTGDFEYGGRYGNMNRYKYQIITTQAISLEWTPPQP